MVILSLVKLLKTKIFCSIQLISPYRAVNTKRNLLYINNQSVPRCKHFSPPVVKPNQLMLYKAIVAACSEIRKKLSTKGGYNVEFLIVKLGST